MKQFIISLILLATIGIAVTSVQASTTRCRPDYMGGWVCTTDPY